MHRTGAGMVANPWLALPSSPDFVLPEDEDAFLRKHGSPLAAHFKTDLLPEPFFGRPDAPVVLLTLNPGYSPADDAVHADPSFRKDARASMEHKLRPYPFLHLQPGLGTPGARWWAQRTRALCESLGGGESAARKVSNGLLCLQYFGYKSATLPGRLRSANLPSQRYTFELLEAAIRRKAWVCVMRSRRLWEAAVEGLVGYQFRTDALCVLSPYVTPGNLGHTGFNEVRRRVADFR